MSLQSLILVGPPNSQFWSHPRSECSRWSGRPSRRTCFTRKWPSRSWSSCGV